MAKTKSIIEPEKIHLRTIENVLVSIDDLEERLNKKDAVSISLAHLSGCNIDDKRYLLGLMAIFEMTLGPEKIEKKCVFRYNFHFEVENLEMMYEMNESGIPVFKKLFVATLAGISYSTLRGIVYEKTSNSNWGSLILPVINPSKLLESWIEVD
jgi:hypothetical protein